MARVVYQQSVQIKAVIRESYRPDTTFRVRGEGRAVSSFSQMPVECVLMEIHFVCYHTTFLAEYQWFRMMGEGVVVETISELTGLPKEKIEGQIEDFLDDAVKRMPQWLASRCLDIYETFLRTPAEIPAGKPRVKAGYQSLLVKIKI